MAQVRGKLPPLRSFECLQTGRYQFRFALVMAVPVEIAMSAVGLFAVVVRAYVSGNASGQVSKQVWVHTHVEFSTCGCSYGSTVVLGSF